jgi:glucose-6-phosphate dehydrogenase assembly protein OpcA
MRKLWKLCLVDQAEGDVARSLTINFFAVADVADADVLNQATERLQRRSPCRAFLLLLDPAAKPGMAEIAATTRGKGQTRDIVLEEILLRCPPAASDQIPGLVRPLLMNDLPNHLLWAKAWPADETMFGALAGLCDHVIVDSKRFLDPAHDLARVAVRRQQGQRITDLAWLRLRPWRRALAEAFERIVWQPGVVTTGLVRHGKAAGSAAQLLVEWLQQRLGGSWQLDTTGDAAASCPDLVRVQTGGYEVELVAPRQQIRVHVTTPEHCYLPFSVPTARGTDGDLLAAAIDLG